MEEAPSRRSSGAYLKEHFEVFKSPSAPRRSSSLSNPDLRTLKSRDGDKQASAAKGTCRSVENLVPERNCEATKKGRLPARELFDGSGHVTKNPSSQFFGADSSIQGSSRSPVLSNSQSWPAPLGLVLPMGFLQHPTAELEIQASFISLIPGFVEIVVGIVTEDKAGGVPEILHNITLTARVEETCITLEPSQGINFEGVFTVRSNKVEANEDQAAGASFSVVLPSKEERAATSFAVE
ncbi:hypothetical protein MTO96_010343 [Rhipicephalus appendiculatus]